jgi:hypothetical protein
MKPEERLAVCGPVNLLLTHRYTQASRCMCVVYLCKKYNSRTRYELRLVEYLRYR